MRARKKSWTQHELTTNGRIIHRPENHRGKWRAYFQNERPIHLEIGCGKGRFITHTANANPQINHIALEREPHVIVMGARAAREQQPPILNLAFVLGDAADLETCFAPGEIDRLYINFCDPWPNRKKWAKRRLTHRNFLTIYRRLLRANGEIFFKTDSQSLFEFSLNEFCAQNFRLRNITLDLHRSDFEGNIMTEYEEKFSGKGFAIYRLEAAVAGWAGDAYDKAVEGAQRERDE